MDSFYHSAGLGCSCTVSLFLTLFISWRQSKIHFFVLPSLYNKRERKREKKKVQKSYYFRLLSFEFQAGVRIAKCTKKKLLFEYCYYLTDGGMVTCVVEDVAIFRHLSLRTAVFSPGRTKSSHSALHTRLCESKGRLLRTYLARDTLIWTICLFELSGGNKQKEDLIPLSFSVLGDCMLSHILRM